MKMRNLKQNNKKIKETRPNWSRRVIKSRLIEDWNENDSIALKLISHGNLKEKSVVIREDIKVICYEIFLLPKWRPYCRRFPFYFHKIASTTMFEESMSDQLLDEHIFKYTHINYNGFSQYISIYKYIACTKKISNGILINSWTYF